MTIHIELPVEIEQTLRRALGDLDRGIKEAALVELYRQHQVTHFQLGQALGLSRFETDALLKNRGVGYELTIDDIRRESESLNGLDRS